MTTPAGTPRSVLILATGAHERMHSVRPQPLHLLCGRPMVQYVIDAARGLDPDRIVVVVGDGADQVAKKLSETVADPRLVVVEQRSGQGTAEAALVGLEVFADDFGEDDLLVVPGNMPLLQRDSIDALVTQHQISGAAVTVLGDDLDDELPLVMCVRRQLLAPAIRRVRPDPTSGAFDLMAIAGVLTGAGHPALAVPFDIDGLDIASEVHRIVDRADLARAEAVIRDRTNLAWMRRGVTMVDPNQTYVDTTVRLATDVTLFPGTMLQGSTVIGAGAEIGPDTRLVDCAVGAAARVEKTMGREAEVGEGARVGPFAVLEPGSHVGPGAVTGPFHHAVAAD